MVHSSCSYDVEQYFRECLSRWQEHKRMERFDFWKKISVDSDKDELFDINYGGTGNFIKEMDLSEKECWDSADISIQSFL